MPLHFVLDGYNIIKSDSTSAFSQMTLQAQREHLERLINTNSPQGSSKNKVTVVYDGTYENSFLGQKHVSGAVDILFSAGDGDTADREIEELVANSSNPAEIVVVTDDRGIQRMIGRTGAKTMGVKEFMKRLFKHPAEDENRPGNDTAPEIDDEFSKRWLK